MLENKVKEVREDMGLSQEQLSMKSGISRSTISDIETGRHATSLEAALRIARALKVPVERLFTLID